jgi:hypothetical protein
MPEINAKDNKAKGVLILNITHTEIIKPVSEMYQRDLNDGR